MLSRQTSVSCSVCALYFPKMYVYKAKSVEGHPSYRRIRCKLLSLTFRSEITANASNASSFLVHITGTIFLLSIILDIFFLGALFAINCCCCCCLDYSSFYGTVLTDSFRSHLPSFHYLQTSPQLPLLTSWKKDSFDISFHRSFYIRFPASQTLSLNSTEIIGLDIS